MKHFILSLLFLFSFFNSNVFAQDNPQAMIVFDASGSMWGQIDGKAKITIAKKALNKVVSNWDENTHLGLIAYGHRKKGDCNDIQTLVPIGKINKSSMISKVKKIKPKGKTPISRSIKKAAKALRYTEEKATVILISDGKETCDADPCGTAKSLESEGIDFVAHVIGFDVDKKTGAQLKCIADVTGGEYFPAKNASSLSDAMTQIVKKVQKEEPKPPVVKKLKNNLEITASESEGSKWVEASHYIYPIIDGEKQDYIKRCSSKKKEVCIQNLPAGKYNVKSTYNEFKQVTNVEIKASELTKLHIIMGQTGKIEISASESEGDKWIKANHYIYPIIDGEKQDYIKRCNSLKKETCIEQIPVGKYSIESTYNEFKQETSFEIKSGDVTKIHVVMGQTGKVEISASESEGSKWIEANHYIYPVIDGEKQDYIKRCNSYKKKTCIKQLPVGKYSIESTFNKFKQETNVEVKASELTKVHVVMGQTGKIEISASESEGSKWVDNARHFIYPIIDGKKQDDHILQCYSYKKKACIKSLPVGKYMMQSIYNKFKQETTFELKPSELTKVNMVMGQTGKIEISASESEGSKWVDDARHFIYPIIDGEKQEDHILQCYSYKKKACIKPLPVGKYTLQSTYNKFKQETTFELKPSELTKVNVVMGQTGKIELSASESEGGKWVDDARHLIYPIIDGEKQEDRILQCYSYKKKACIKSLPLGKYAMQSTYKKFKKDTRFELNGNETTKININFAPFHLSVEGINQCSEVLHEVISSTGRTITEAKAAATNGANFVLPAGNYTIESTSNNITQKTKIVIGGDNPTKDAVVHFGNEDANSTIAGLWKTSQREMTLQLNGTTVTGTYGNDNGTINGEMTYPQRFEGYWTETTSDHKCQASKHGSDYWGKTIWEFDKSMCSFKGKWGYCDKKPNSNWTGSYLKAVPMKKTESHEDLIKADSDQSSTTKPEPQAQANEVAKKPDLNTKMEDAKKAMAQAGALINDVQKLRKKPIQAFKKSVTATLPIIKEAKTCYEGAGELSQAKECEALEEKALVKAQEIMKAEAGVTSKTNNLDKHSDWNEEIKKETVEKTSNDISKMELSIICIDKGADFSDLKKCMDNVGQYTPKD